MKPLILCLAGLLFSVSSLAQLRVNGSLLEPDSLPNRARTIAAHAVIGSSYAITMTVLGVAWYAEEDLVGFHFFDDSHQWKQVDKVGHAFGGYLTSNLFMSMYRWGGMPRAQAMWLGGMESWLSMGSIEVFDAFGESWGFSWSDIGANSAGVGLAMMNEALWQEQRVKLKWNYLPSPYAGDPAYERLFGSNFPEWALKDYNGQSYWLSVNVHDFLPESGFKDKYPSWMNVAVGYGANGLEGGYDDPNGSWTVREYRKWYLSLDIDTSQIETRHEPLRVLLSLLSVIRIPMPALRWDRNGLGVEPLR